MVAALAQENMLPAPELDLASLAPSTSAFGQYPVEVRAPAPVRAYSEDPWNVPKFPGTSTITPNITNGTTSNIAGTGLPREWWRKQDNVTVNILGQQGFILNRYLVYEVATEVKRNVASPSLPADPWLQRAAPVPRRYSEFVILWDCLVRRYPFRLLPSLPPKRLGRKSRSRTLSRYYR